MLKRDLPIKSNNEFFCPFCKTKFVGDGLAEGTFMITCSKCENDFYVTKSITAVYESRKEY